MKPRMTPRTESRPVISCDVCARFISYADLEAGRATRKLVSPDSEYSFEQYETLCAKCREKVTEVAR